MSLMEGKGFVDEAVLKNIEHMLNDEAGDILIHDSHALQAIQDSFLEIVTQRQKILIVNSVQRFSMPLEFNHSHISDSVVDLFRRGVEEANKFLPPNKPLCIGIPNNSDNMKCLAKIRKVHHQANNDEEQGDPKQLATCEDEDELAVLFNRLFLDSKSNMSETESLNDAPHQISQMPKRIGKSGRLRKRAFKKKEAVDLGNLLVKCAIAVAGDERARTKELLKHIRQHSTPFGDGSQRVAHYFANGIEARLEGNGPELYKRLDTTLSPSYIDLIKVHKSFMAVCPFRMVGSRFAYHHILKLARQRLTTLHIIDFGIYTGFQWMELIMSLSDMPGGPPMLRITGIDLPQTGLRPECGVEMAGIRLEKYCKRFKVPFKYNGIAQKWETIKLKDLEIRRNEANIVICMLRMEKLHDGVSGDDSPRGMVLKLIRSVNPEVFVHFTIHASYNAALFRTRFRETMFHYMMVFDMMDAVLGRECEERLVMERFLLGRDVMNIVACEGSERVERAEKYKRWQVRTQRAGFRQMPLDRKLVEKLRAEVETNYHKDLVMDEDEGWLLQGWKGRTICAICCWVPE